MRGATATELARLLTSTPTPSAGVNVGIKPCSLIFGAVVSVQVGPPKSLTITGGGSAVQIAGVRYSSTYTPTAGDRIAILVSGPDWFVLGAVA